MKIAAWFYMIFKNRSQAGEKLADSIETLRSLHDPIVLALPRGGLPVALPVAKRLKAPLDILVVHKIGAPENPEYGIGAITEDGYYWLNQQAVSLLGVTSNTINRLLEIEFSEVRRRIQQYRMGRALPDLRGRSVILVDDGVATGVTAAVATQAIKQRGAREVILAVPTGAPESVQLLETQADQVVVLDQPQYFSSVGQWYDDFPQISDQEVIDILKEGSEASLKPFEGDLELPKSAKGVVVFAHGSGSSRLSPRNQKIARALNLAGFGTLLFDLLTEEESSNRSNVFDIPFLAGRLLLATEWVRRELASLGMKGLPIGYFGASTGAAAALWAASMEENPISAIVSRGGRPDLALPRLRRVRAPTLLIVGGDDEPVLEMNNSALKLLHQGRLVVVPGATHLFEEPGAMEEVARHAIHWFENHLARLRRVA